MEKERTPEFVIQWTKFTTGILFTWPPSLNTTRQIKITLKICWWISLIVAVTNAIPMLTTAYKYRTNFMKFTESLYAALCFIQVVSAMIIAKFHNHRFQCLIEEVKTFVNNANPHEREVLMNYVKRVTPSYFRYNMLGVGTILAYVIGLFILDHPLPNIVEFPFSVYDHPVYYMVLIMEILGGGQCACTGAFICQLCLLIWYGTIQLTFLAEKVEDVTCLQELAECISIHQHILWYIKETMIIVRHMVACIIVLTTLSIACGGIHIVRNETLFSKVQTISILIAYALELLCIAWAAENLTTISARIGFALYNSLLMPNSKAWSKDAIFMMQRCLNPPKIKIAGLMSNLSMEYYAKYMSAVYSFFTTLRILLKKFEDN
ncbi:uncharacterized protein LOC114841737 [Diachasma alloeum]|uniref:Odorant receptor n=1 Tax=Diachasma alloeum TaxID=454923 RepID=A0A4E0S3P3_9HYME|nr:uncharacterized protein LOC114841737 [Diachasma alloeum]THK32915.1 odorant receptor 52 [Diachasma alloeum]